LGQIRSVTDGAEIEADKRYLGSTPSVVRLAPGDYRIQLSKSGFRTWKRTVTLTPGGFEIIKPSMEPR
jgi:PEGA domain